MSAILDYALKRLREPSTWRGALALLTAVGIKLQPDQMEAIVTVGMALIGAVGVFAPDPKKTR